MKETDGRNITAPLQIIFSNYRLFYNLMSPEIGEITCFLFVSFVWRVSRRLDQRTSWFPVITPGLGSVHRRAAAPPRSDGIVFRIHFGFK